MTDTKDGGTASLWDINHERAEDRIRARRKRISNRLEAAKRLATILKVQSIFGAAGGPGAAQGKDAAEVVLVEGKYVLNQCRQSRHVVNEVLENGNELVGNVLIAAEHLQVQHRESLEERNEALRILLEKEDMEAEAEFERIQKSWPPENVKRQGPTDLFAKILMQKSSCNDLLEKKNDLISTLEEEIRESDNQYKQLIDQYHENTAVLSNRMEHQIRAIERLVVAERGNILAEFNRQKQEGLASNVKTFDQSLSRVDRKAQEHMEERLRLLNSNERDLDEMILADAEAFLDSKIALEANIKAVADQIQHLDSVHQLNEERLDYEIHVLRKHEEEVVLVKSDQKRKITGLMDAINRLRQKVAECHKNIAKEEATLQANNEDVRKQLQKLDELRKSNTQHSETKKRQIIEMVRDDVGSKIKGMVETDWKLQQMLLPADLANKVELYTEPLKSKSQQTYGSSKSFSRRSSSRPLSESHSSSSTRDETTTLSTLELDEGLRKMLSELVREANFLVEENLGALVEGEEINEDEKNLFKLDSILSAVGVEFEDQVLDVLRKTEIREEGLSKTKESILKIIRSHVQEKRRTRVAQGGGLGPDEQNADGGGAAPALTGQRGENSDKVSRPTAKVRKWDLEQMEWSAMTESVRKMKDPVRLKVLDELKLYQRLLAEAKELEEDNERLNRTVRELTLVANKLSVGLAESAARRKRK